VLVGAHALLANGGVMAAVGAQLVALAAQRHAVPFVVLAGLHKLSPLFPHNPAITLDEYKFATPRLAQRLLRRSMGLPMHPLRSHGHFLLVAQHGRARYCHIRCTGCCPDHAMPVGLLCLLACY